MNAGAIAQSVEKAIARETLKATRVPTRFALGQNCLMLGKCERLARVNQAEIRAVGRSVYGGDRDFRKEKREQHHAGKHAEKIWSCHCQLSHFNEPNKKR